MSDAFLPFSKPTINQDAIDEVVNCIESGWLTTGPRVKQFEADLQNYCEAPFALCLSSATAGLHLALLSLNLQLDDEVITTPLSFVATTNTIVQAGAKPVFVDLKPNSLNIDEHKIVDAITEKTRAILPVHFSGLPVDLDVIYDLAEQHNLRVIEDCAHAIGASYKGKKLGSFGDTQVFSFHPNKNMTTGEGGCVTTRDEQLAKNIENLRFHGIDREAWQRDSKTGSPQYWVTQPGFKYNMMDIQAALGIHQLKQLDTFIQQRNKLANYYHEKLSLMPQWQLTEIPNYEHQHAWHLMNPLLNTEVAGIDRDEFIAQMRAKDIGVGLHYQALHTHPYYQKRFGYQVGDFPIAEDVCNRIVSLPLFPGMTNADVDRVINTAQTLFTP